MEHGPDCNCEGCWWAHDQKVVDEFGMPVDSNEQEKENGSMDKDA